jgi:hypothetical protein
MKKIICSGALFYTLDTNRFLLLHRTQSKQNDVWGLVGGTNEEKETEILRFSTRLFNSTMCIRDFVKCSK